MFEHVLPCREISIVRDLTAQILGLDQPFAPFMLAALAQPLVLNCGRDMEEQLDDQRAMIALLRFEFVNLVIGAGPVLGLATAERPVVNHLAIPAAVMQRRVAGGRKRGPEARQPMPVLIGAITARDAMRGEMAWVPGGCQPLQGALLAAAFPAFEQDDGALAVNGLGELEHRKPILQRGKRRSEIASERFPPFKLR